MAAYRDAQRHMQDLNLPGLLIKPREPAQGVLMLLHGYGASGKDLLSLGKALANDRFYCFMPDGIEPCEMHPQGRQWFSLKNIDFQNPQSISSLGLDTAALLLKETLVSAMGSWDIPLFIGGFSQGAALAVHMGLCHMPVKGVLNFSGFYHMHLCKEQKYAPPVFLYHGQKDDVVPIQFMETCERELRAHNIAVSSYICPTSYHGISSAGIIAAERFITSAISVL